MVDRDRARKGVAIAVEGLVKRYGEFRAVDGIDISIETGEIFGLLGPNGAGKTTTIECIVGLRKPTEGRVTVLGLNPTRQRKELTRRVAVQPQSASIFENLTVAESLRLFASFHSRPLSVGDVLELIGLTDQARSRAGKLSGGQMRRLLLGVALIGRPEVLVLDEPSAGLDPMARQSLWGLIRRLRDDGATILLSTHHMDEATQLCDRVAILVGGKVAAMDSPDELVRYWSRESSISFTLNLDADLGEVERLIEASTFHHIDVAGGIRVTAKTEIPDAAVRRLTFARGITAREFNIRPGSLEDVFLDLSAQQDERRQHESRASQDD